MYKILKISPIWNKRNEVILNFQIHFRNYLPFYWSNTNFEYSNRVFCPLTSTNNLTLLKVFIRQFFIKNILFWVWAFKISVYVSILYGILFLAFIKVCTENYFIRYINIVWIQGLTIFHLFTGKVYVWHLQGHAN